MNRKLDLPTLLLFTALLLGAIIRFYPAVSNGFPLNDGGMFYTMIRDLKANHYLLPQLTTYNFADIPFVYPPLGFYIAALLSTLLPVSELWVLLYIPALINTLSILFFYKFAEQTLSSRLSAALAVLVFALSPRSFLWQVMGGGITRSFGLLFMLLMLWQATIMLKPPSSAAGTPPRAGNINLALAILFGAGAVLSHPQTALHAVLGGTLIFIFYGFTKRGFISVFFIGLGLALVTAPWWLTVLTRHGLQPFVSAGQTSQRTLESYLAILRFDGIGDYLFIPTLLFAIIGVWTTFKQRGFFLITWAVLAYLIDPRGGDGIALLALSMLAGIGLLKFLAWISRSDGGQACPPEGTSGRCEFDRRVEAAFMKRGVQILLFGLVLYFVMVAGIFDFRLINTSLKANNLEMIDWVKSNVSGEKTFL
ncbi:MAG: hypothetical protein Q8O48_11685, partial [Anaerolineales bacterium]|nr:hypothetical protein [Anaerolineales bacterium]